MIIGVKFIKKPNMVQVIGHRNQALINSEIQKKRMYKIGATIGKTYIRTINLKI